MKTFNIIKGFFFICLITIFSFSVNAQSGNEGGGLQEMKIGFLTEQLDLTKEEAEKFWPIYTAYDNAKDKLSKKYEKSGDEVEKQEEKTALLKKYNAEFKKVLSADKVKKLYKAEDSFKKKLLEEYKKRQEKQNKKDK
mgnify:CR=1 FL=1